MSRFLVALAALAWLPVIALRPAIALADEEEEDDEVTEEPCTLPGGGAGNLVTTRGAESCGQRGCTRPVQVELVDQAGRTLFVFDDQTGDEDELAKLTSNRRGVSFAWGKAELHFALKHGSLELAADSAAALAKLWTGPPPRARPRRARSPRLRKRGGYPA